MALILVVDDEPDLLALLVDQVSSLGYDVVAARDGAEGLRLALDRRPDVILTDVIMPYMDGPEMLDRLRSRPESGGRLLPEEPVQQPDVERRDRGQDGKRGVGFDDV